MNTHEGTVLQLKAAVADATEEAIGANDEQKTPAEALGALVDEAADLSEAGVDLEVPFRPTWGGEAEAKAKRPRKPRGPRMRTMREGVLRQREPASESNRRGLEDTIGRRTAVEFLSVHLGRDRYQLLVTDQGEVFSWLERGTGANRHGESCPRKVSR